MNSNKITFLGWSKTFSKISKNPKKKKKEKGSVYLRSMTEILITAYLFDLITFKLILNINLTKFIDV